MSEIETKEFFNKLEKVLSDDEHNFIPRAGIIRPRCLCGGNIYQTGRGIIRDVCDKCGQIYHPMRY